MKSTLKTILLAPLFLALPVLGLKAQNANLTASDSTVTALQQPTDPLRLTNLYAGSYAVGTIDEQTLKNGKMPVFGSIRIGGAAKLDITTKLNATGVVAYDHTSGGDGKILHNLTGNYTPVEGTTLSVGKVPTAGTHMISPPLTPDGHFLFTAENQAPLPGVGAKVSQQIGKNQLAASSVLRTDGVESSIYFNRGPVSGALVLDPTTNKLNGGISWIGDLANGSNIFSMIRVKPESFSGSGMYTFPNKLSVFVDGQYDRIADECTHFQVGALQSFNKDNMGIKLGAAIDPVNKNVQTILFINLSK